jgi:hypothetical protein
VDAFRENAMVIGAGYHSLQIVCLIVLLAALFQIGRTINTVSESAIRNID